MIELTRRSAILGLGAAAGLVACGGKETLNTRRELGVAVAGVGGVAVRNVLPALKKSEHCRVAALIDLDTEALKPIGKQFGVPESALYKFADFDRIAANPDIDIVYIAMPNGLHSEYAIRAARAGKHVLCEKPMAVTVAQCEAMIAASREADRLLAMAYRVNFSAHHQDMLRRLSNQEFGRVQIVRADIGYPLEEPGGWRLNRKLAGGGVLLEQGVYAVNTARTIAGADPVEVLGYEMKSGQKRFSDVEEGVSWSMRFANDVVAHCTTSYTVPANRIWVGGSEGWYQMDEAYSLEDMEAHSSSGDIDIREHDQFRRQADNFSRLIQDGKQPGVGISAQDGLRDVRIINAIYESMQTQRVVQLPALAGVGLA